MTAVEKDGYLYGVDGHGPQDAFLVCVDRKTGKEVWRKQPEWEDAEPDGQGGSRTTVSGLYRCSLLPVDGRCLCLGEYGHLLWLDLQPAGLQGTVPRPPVQRPGNLDQPRPEPRPALRQPERP